MYTCICTRNLSATRKYASAAVLEDNVESAVSSFIEAVDRNDGVVDIPQEMMRMTYNFIATMCFGQP